LGFTEQSEERMEKNVNARAEAIKEMSKEKVRIFRKETQELSHLEKAALAWKKKKTAEGKQSQKELFPVKGGKEISREFSFREAVAKEVVDYDRQKMFGMSREKSDNETSWAQYKPWQKEEDTKKKQIPLNTATVVAIRKKLIAREWARALGKRTKDTKFHDLEQEAATWYQKKDEEKRRKEEIRARIEKHKEALSEVLIEFGKKLNEKKDTASPKESSILLEGSLESAGEVFDIEWQENGCWIWIEPWEEKKLRKISGFDIPVIYRAQIDENLQIASYEEVEDEEAIESLREEILTKPFRESLEEASFSIDKENAARQFLEEKLSCIGRLSSLKRTETGWFATIESWEEMRLRNMKRRGRSPVVTEEIEINWTDGKLEFVPEHEEGEEIEEEEVKDETRNQSFDGAYSERSRRA